MVQSVTVRGTINILLQYPMDAEVRIKNNKLQVKVSHTDSDEEWEPDMDDFGTYDLYDCC